ncbi:MAG TPA: low specificity L-threonine aldolase [Acidocella sp.]|jgi:threonine aldolase|uniref:threonine aldolase family protein n=1 Tax=Acidocella sp. TaxID=50710 RepID=UPI002BF90D6E|nr:low specificity L-threonine aldolase [Acidocella sp.]HVE23378.1 low specificity L-threonine aldolase [Acidocella sp.]
MTEPCLDFSSDNVTQVAPEIMAAIVEANHGTAHGYGNDPWTEKLTACAREMFECDLAIYPVATGTAANALALAELVPPHGGIYCHESAHIQRDECGAPELFTGGAKLLAVPTADGRLAPQNLRAIQEAASVRGVHCVKPSAISVSQATEWGTVYTPDQISALAAFGRAHDLRLHMDGARFANAVAHLGCTPAEASWKAGVDVLSFGATKNGAMGAEAVIFFNREQAGAFEYRRKRGAQLLSKMRFISAQLLASLQDGLWLRHGRHANDMASRLARGLHELPGMRLIHEVQANELFVSMPEAVVEALLQDGYGFYRWPAQPGMETRIIRLVTAWSTRETDVDGLLAAAKRHVLAEVA